MNSKTITLCFLLLLSFSINAQTTESDYQYLIHQQLGGQREYKVESGYVDILTEDYAIEVKFANKWKHAIGQALWYALQTNKKAGIVLVKKKETDYKYVIQLGSALSYAGLDSLVKVWVWPDDFDNTENSWQNAISPDQESSSGQYWITKSSKIRHNSRCGNFENTNGKHCSATDGVACKRCGG